MKTGPELEQFDESVQARISKITDEIIAKLDNLDFFSELRADIDALEIPPDKIRTLDDQLQSAMKGVVGTRWGRYVRD